MLASLILNCATIAHRFNACVEVKSCDELKTSGRHRLVQPWIRISFAITFTDYTLRSVFKAIFVNNTYHRILAETVKLRKIDALIRKSLKH